MKPNAEMSKQIDLEKLRFAFSSAPHESLEIFGLYDKGLI